MSVLAYVLGALLISFVVMGVLWFREQRPSSLEDGIDEFNRAREARAPDWQPPMRKSTRPRDGESPG